jgi:hypothetical protein
VTLHGTYGIGNIGWSISGGTPAPFSVADFDRLKGDGTGTGVVVAANTRGTSTYSINADCTGRMVFSNAGPPALQYVRGPLRGSFRVVATDPGVIISDIGTRVNE